MRLFLTHRMHPIRIKVSAITQNREPKTQNQCKEESSMKVLVTGGIGAVGKAVLERLLRNGWDVRVMDRTPEYEMAGIDYRVGDITKYEEMREQVRGCDVIVHLAAIANPMFVPPHELFHINVQGTYNVYEA